MKVKTNLSPRELRKVGVGLQKLADQQQSEIELENSAERKLISSAEAMFATAIDNLQEEVERILSDKEV